MSFSFPVLSLLCLPLAFPAFYLAYKLASKRSLGSIFNQNIFFLFIVTIIPSSISSSEILRDSTQPSLAAVYCISAWCRGTLGKTFRSSVARRSGGSTPSSSTSTSGIYQPHKKCLSCFSLDTSSYTFPWCASSNIVVELVTQSWGHNGLVLPKTNSLETLTNELEKILWVSTFEMCLADVMFW